MSEEKIIVLYVDDEENNLQSFKATFRRDFKVITASSAKEAIELLKDVEPHVIITDQRMPDMTGTEFLKTIQYEYPDPVRILLTGYSDIEAVIDAINHAKVYQYLTKPWDIEELRQTIINAHRTHQLQKDKDEEINYFIYKASHDLRGPLVSINGLVDLARREGGDPEKLSKYLRLVELSIGSLENSLNDLIEFKRMDQTALKTSLIDFDDILQDVVRGVKHTDNYGKVEVRSKVNQEGEFKNDRGVIRSVLLNLIQNAVKYSRSDIQDPYVAVKIMVNEKEALIEVSDNGIGMPEMVIQNIYKMFYRGNSEKQGSGLGLYIVKMGIKKIGGTIDVKSVQQKGTTFRISIPNNNVTILKRENVLKQHSA